MVSVELSSVKFKHRKKHMTYKSSVSKPDQNHGNKKLSYRRETVRQLCMST